MSKNVLEFIFRLSPPFAFHFGILNITNLNLFKLIFEYDRIKSPFDFDGALWDLLFLIFTGIIFFLLILVVENSYKFINKVNIRNTAVIDREIEEEEKSGEDVEKEEKRVRAL